jgi:Trimethylamine methyltransferase (MTTB)
LPSSAAMTDLQARSARAGTPDAHIARGAGSAGHVHDHTPVRLPSDVAQRALCIWKGLLDAYEPPPLAPDRREALVGYVAHRKEEIRREGLR